MRTTTINGATIGWTDAGSGDATLLVHAGAFGAWFAPLADRLPGRVIRLLRAGYAGGATPPRPIDVEEHAGHAAALLEALHAAPATVVGHSSGSAIALQLALDRPELVSRLVLSEPPLLDVLLDPADVDDVHAHLGAAMGAAMTAWGRGDLPAAFDAFMAAVCGPGYRAVLADVLGPDGLARAEREAAFFFANEVPAFGRWAPVDLNRIACPVLLVQGAESPTATHRLVARLAAILPDALVRTIAETNHLLPLTHPAELASAIASWTRTGRGPATTETAAAALQPVAGPATTPHVS